MKLKLWAIAAGFLVDIMGSFVLGGWVGVIIQGVRHTTPNLSVSVAIGLLMAVAGGFVAASLARDRYIAHGLAVGVLDIALSVAFEGAGLAPSGWLLLMSYVLVIPAAVLGGYLASRIR